MPKNKLQSASRLWPHFNPSSTSKACGDYVSQSPHKMRPLNWLLSGLLSLCLFLSLTGCASTEYVRVKERDTPPMALIQDCTEPSPNGVTTNGELTAYVGQLRLALRNCNNNMALIREWSKD